MHATLCDFLSDIVQNSIEAEAKNIQVVVEEDAQSIRCTVEDDGKGMSENERRNAMNPFHTDGRKHAERSVGLGLPFLVQAVEAVDGSFSLQSGKGRGTAVSFRFPLNHVDCPPLGDMVSTLVSMLSFPGEHRMVVRRSCRGLSESDGYKVDRTEMRELLGDLSSSWTLHLLRTFLQSQETALDKIRIRV